MNKNELIGNIYRPRAEPENSVTKYLQVNSDSSPKLIGSIGNAVSAISTISWGALLKDVAPAIGSWLGSKFIDRLLGQQTSFSSDDLEVLLRRTVENVLSEVLDQYDLMLLKRDYVSLIRLYIQYRSSRRIDLLQEVDQSCTKLIVGLEDHGEPAGGLLAMAYMLKLSVLQEFDRLEKSDHVSFIISQAESYGKELKVIADERKKVIEERFPKVGGVVSRESEPGLTEYGYMYNGRFYLVYLHTNSSALPQGVYDSVQSQRNDHMNQILDEEWQPIEVCHEVCEVVSRGKPNE